MKVKKIHTNWKAANARLTKACILACLFLTILTSYAQTSEKKITLTCDKVPFEKALQRLAQQAGVFFAYSLNFADANRPVSFSVKNESMNTALIRICGQMGFEYKQQGKHFILRKKVALPKTPVKKATVVAKASPKIAQPTVPSVKKDSTPVVAAAPVKETARDPQMDSVTIAMDSLLASADTIQADTDTLLVFDLDKPAPKVDTLADSVLVFLFKKSARSRKIVTPSRTYTYHPHPLPSIRTGADLERFLFGRRNDSEPDTTQSDTLQPETNNNRQASDAKSYQTRRASGRSSRAYSQWQSNGSGFMVRPGIYFNEVTYLGAELQLGTPLVFGIVNLGLTNNSITRIGYGAGFSLPVASRWSVGAEFTTAKVRRSFEYADLALLPEEFDVQLSSWHHRIQAVLCWQVYPRLQLALSPTFNWLNTRYTANGYKQGIEMLDATHPVSIRYLSFLDFLRTQNTIRPPYAFSDFNSDLDYVKEGFGKFRVENFRNTKMWIGGQVGIYYTFGGSFRR